MRLRWLGAGFALCVLLCLSVVDVVGCQAPDCPVCQPTEVCSQEPARVSERPRYPEPGARPEPVVDRGSVPDKAVPKDEGKPDNPIFSPVTACGPPTSSFYDAPSSVPRQRGQLMRCESLGGISAAALGKDPRYAGVGGAAANGYLLFRIMYATEAPKGRFQAATAIAYIPVGGNQSCLPSAPIAVVAHGTTGAAPACGPSRFPNFGLHHLAMPLAGRGAAVVAPDLLGLGVRASGGHPYLVTEPTQSGMADAVKAMASLGSLAAYKGCFSRRVLLMGHSQGGHAALVTALAFASELSGFEHVGTVAIAPAFGDVRVWRGPFQASLASGVATAYYLAYLIAAARYSGGPALNTWLTTKAAKWLPGWLDSFCFNEWTSLFLNNFPTFGDIFQPAFLKASQDCATKGDCQSFAPWVALTGRSEVKARAGLAPTLLVQGALDQVVSAASVGCIQKRYRDVGAKVDVCVEPMSNHSSIIAASWKGSLPWITAALQGKAPASPTCSSATLPVCP